MRYDAERFVADGNGNRMFKAKVIILMLGTNNINSAPNDQIAEATG